MFSKEIEAKVLLSKNDYNLLFDNFSNKYCCHIITQINYYIDSNQLMVKKQHCSLRVRYIINENNYILTLKTPLIEGRKEYNENIDENQFKALTLKKIFPRGNIYEELLKLNINIQSLHILTYLKTYRLEFKYKDSIVCLDKNVNTNLEDYELEVESSSLINAKKIAKELLSNINQKEVVFNNIGKETRALKALKTID